MPAVNSVKMKRYFEYRNNKPVEMESGLVQDYDATGIVLAVRTHHSYPEEWFRDRIYPI
jgi:hypothetical protein